MDIYSYAPHTVPGPNGYTIRMKQPDDDSPNALDLVEISGRRYVGVPSVTTMPEQPVEIDWRAEASPPAEVFQSRWFTHILTPQLHLLAAIRWEKVSSGTVWNDWPVRTLPGDEAAVAAAYSAARAGSRSDTARWKFADGVFRPLTNAQMIELAEHVFARTQAHFEHEADLTDKLRDGQQPDLNEGWPN
jgi:hypothetical protein